jgi:hypothetical protein
MALDEPNKPFIVQTVHCTAQCFLLLIVNCTATFQTFRSPLMKMAKVMIICGTLPESFPIEKRAVEKKKCTLTSILLLTR